MKKGIVSVLVLSLILFGCGTVIEAESPELNVFGSVYVEGEVTFDGDDKFLLADIFEVEGNDYLILENNKLKVHGDFFEGTFEGKLRCSDGRVNSQNEFAVNDCYWELEE
jgi:hypothetical protein